MLDSGLMNPELFAAYDEDTQQKSTAPEQIWQRRQRKGTIVWSALCIWLH
jgi:hypothetical protein